MRDAFLRKKIRAYSLLGHARVSYFHLSFRPLAHSSYAANSPPCLNQSHSAARETGGTLAGFWMLQLKLHDANV